MPPQWRCNCKYSSTQAQWSIQTCTSTVPDDGGAGSLHTRAGRLDAAQGLPTVQVRCAKLGKEWQETGARTLGRAAQAACGQAPTGHIGFVQRAKRFAGGEGLRWAGCGGTIAGQIAGDGFHSAGGRYQTSLCRQHATPQETVQRVLLCARVLARKVAFP